MGATVKYVRFLGIQEAHDGTNGSLLSFKTWYSVTLEQPTPPDPYSWRVAFNASGVDEDGNSVTIPGPNAYDNITYFFAHSRGVQNEGGDDGAINFRVWVEWKPMPWVNVGGNPPWLYLDVVERLVKKYSVPMTKDYSSPTKAIQNSAFDPPAEPLMHELINPFLRIHRHRKSSNFDYPQAQKCQMTVNPGTFTINEVGSTVGSMITTNIPALNAYCHSVVAHQETWTDGSLYHDIVIELEIYGQYPQPIAGVLPNPNMQTVLLQNRGFRVLQTGGDPTTKVHATALIDNLDNNIPPNVIGTPLKYYAGTPLAGQNVLIPVTQPVFLKLDGTQWPKDGSDPTVADLVFNRCPVGATSDWNNLGTGLLP